MVEFFAIPQLPDCTPQSAKYSSFCQYTVDLEDKQLYFPVYIINFSEYYYILILLFWYVLTYIVFVRGLNFRLDI